jgi:oligopeptide transport system ATP-binding protein
MALITQPKLLIADEPTTALDVTVQAQILILMKKLQTVHGMSMIFVTHDLGVVAGICDRVMVMYAGRIIEQADVRSLFHDTKHPYTRALIASLPSAHGSGEELKVIPGKPPDLSGDLSGCPFAPRCDFAAPRCRTESISLDDVGEGHLSACMRVRDGEVRL